MALVITNFSWDDQHVLTYYPGIAGARQRPTTRVRAEGVVAVWTWMLPTYLGFTVLAGVTALLVALFVPEDQPDRRKTAFHILKLFFGTGSGLTLIVGAATHLTQTGLL